MRFSRIVKCEIMLLFIFYIRKQQLSTSFSLNTLWQITFHCFSNKVTYRNLKAAKS